MATTWETLLAVASEPLREALTERPFDDEQKQAILQHCGEEGADYQACTKNRTKHGLQAVPYAEWYHIQCDEACAARDTCPLKAA